MNTKNKHNGKCSNCGSTKTKTFWDFDDGSILCDKCHNKIGHKWESINRRKKIFDIFNKNKKVFSIVVVLLLLVLIGFAIKQTLFTCPISCDDGIKCTNDYCSAETHFKCSFDNIIPCKGNEICETNEYGTSDCLDCNDNNKCTKDSIDYDTLECINVDIVPCEGNNVCEEKEYGSDDCPSCDDDNKCTKDSINYEILKCNHEPIKCDDNDKCTQDICLPKSGCKYNIIKFCNGNDICEEGEFGSSKDCPNCEDDNKCTENDYNYSSKKCVFNKIENCCSVDGCYLNINKKINNYISITLDKISIYKDSRYDDLIKVDITIENIGYEKITYRVYDSVILGKNNNQFEMGYSSDFDELSYGDLYPEYKKEGSIFFETKEYSELNLKELLIPTGLSSYYKEERSIGNGDSLFYNEEHIFKYDLSNLNFT